MALTAELCARKKSFHNPLGSGYLAGEMGQFISPALIRQHLRYFTPTHSDFSIFRPGHQFDSFLQIWFHVQHNKSHRRSFVLWLVTHKRGDAGGCDNLEKD